jgi:hypothetical protein
MVTARRRVQRGRVGGPPEEVAMTVSQLHALYVAAHAQARRLAPRPSHELTVSCGGITALERLILELALLDATNGTPARTLPAFTRALEHGADVLSALGLRLERTGPALAPGSPPPRGAGPGRGIDRAA